MPLPEMLLVQSRFERRLRYSERCGGVAGALQAAAHSIGRLRENAPQSGKTVFLAAKLCRGVELT